MSASLPKLRTDLVRSQQSTDDGSAYVIKDPVRGEFFRLREAEGFIAEQLDGETSLDVVQRRVEQRFGARLAHEELAEFIKTLDQSELLETERSGRTRRRNRALVGSWLYLRLKLFDPERLLDRVIGRVRFFFTPSFVYLSCALILAAVVVSAFNRNEIVAGIAALADASTLPLLIAAIFIAMSAHEFAHALTCKHFGGSVREMGFMLLYFQPALYCNVSDAWLFPEKSRRLWVGFAGAYVELFLWALATLAWRLTDGDAWINRVALVFMAITGIKTLFNINPLIKLDGYYLLSDYLEMPNLRQKSFAYVGSLLKRIGGRTGATDVTARERRIYLGYGITAWLFSLSFFTYISLIVGEYLIVDQQRIAFFAFTGLVAFRYRDIFGRLFRRESKTSRSRSGGSQKGERARRFPMRAVLKLAAAGALLVLLFAVPMELRVSGTVHVLPLHNADVRPAIEGIVEEIFVDEGQSVRKGDLVARLSGREHRAALQQTEAQIRQVTARLELLIAGPTKEQIGVARSVAAKAEDQLAFARAKQARELELYEQNLLSSKAFDLTRELVARAEHELDEARGQLRVLLEGSRPEEIKGARAELARLEAQRRYLASLLERVDVPSPATGVVTTPNRVLEHMVGQLVPKGGLIAKVHELDTVTVEAAISETEIADVAIGQKIAVKVRAHPERVFYGKVLEIGTTTEGSLAAQPDRSGGAAGLPTPAAADKPATAIRVITELENDAGLLKPGMTGMAKVYCGKRRIIDLITRRLSRTFRVEFWSWW